MTDLKTQYLGLLLKNPIVASASPLTGTIAGLISLEEAGAAAVVLPSLFEEQVEHEARTLDEAFGGHQIVGTEMHEGFFPSPPGHSSITEDYVDLLAAAKRELSIPVFASLNGYSDGGWTHFAALLEDAGADGIELNVYHIAADLDATSLDVEDRYLRLVEQIRKTVAIPLAVKVGPYFSSPGNMARRLISEGAESLVLFNRFYQPDIDLETLSVVPALELSSSVEMRLVLRWMAILRGRIEADLAATTGVHHAEDVVKLILAGADVAMMTSALLQRGPQHLTTVLEGVHRWFNEREYVSSDQARGSMSQESVPDPAAFERSNYMKTLSALNRQR